MTRLTLAEQIADRRRALGLTQAEFAERAGTTQAGVSAYENGRRRFATLVRYADALGCDVRLVPRDGRRTDEETLHRFLTGWPLVDHINGNGLDNRRTNLRSANQSQNQANRHAVTSRSGFKGVTYHKRSGRWQAAVQHRYIGLFDTPEAAARAYDRAAVAVFGAFARTNFPQAEAVAA